MHNSVIVQLTNGFGNNLFQVLAGKLLAQKHGRDIQVLLPWENYYGLKSLNEVLVDSLSVYRGNLDGQIVIVNDENYDKAFQVAQLPSCCILVSGYFEDFRFFVSNREIIKSWFKPTEKKNTDDLIFHFRTGDRLFLKDEFNYKITADRYKAAIEMFEFRKLHIVSDLPELRHYAPGDLLQLKFHNNVDPSKSIEVEKSSDYLNKIVDMLEEYKPIFEPSSIAEDFNKIRSFDKIMLEHGTMSWWAAFLSNANYVGVRHNWRPWKGTNNKNLSNIPIPGWFEWGKI